MSSAAEAVVTRDGRLVEMDVFFVDLHGLLVYGSAVVPHLSP